MRVGPRALNMDGRGFEPRPPAYQTGVPRPADTCRPSSGGGIRTPVTPVTTGHLATRTLPIMIAILAPRRRIELLSRPRQDRVCASKRPGRERRQRDSNPQHAVDVPL